MTPVGVFFICQNEDKCHFVNSTGLCRKSGMVIRARSLVFFLFQPVSYIGKEAPPGSAADHQFLNAHLAQTLSVNSANALFFMFAYGKIHK